MDFNLQALAIDGATLEEFHVSPQTFHLIIYKLMFLNYPSTNKLISLSFGYNSEYDANYKNFYTLFDNKHPGVDFDLKENTQVFASFDGIVIRKEFHKGMGNTLGIRNGNILSLYAHLNEINVVLGQIVNSHELVGLSGNTGEATTSPHLHFELRDLSKKELKDMVFKPVFDTYISNFKNEFIYIVNNQNTPKTAQILSQKYFGNENFANLILEKNNLSLKTKDIIPNGLNLIIPNFRNQ